MTVLSWNDALSHNDFTLKHKPPNELFMYNYGELICFPWNLQVMKYFHMCENVGLQQSQKHHQNRCALSKFVLENK